MNVPVAPGTVCIITGGGRGIGRGTAEALAARGCLPALCARTAAELTETADAIESDTGIRPFVSTVDVTDWPSVDRFASEVAANLGPPTLLVNNAAILGPVGPITACDPVEWARTLTVNVAGTAVMSAVVAPTMTGGGAIVNLSGGGIGGPAMAPFMSSYVASKAAVVALTEALAGELAPRITVNAVAPGAMATRFMEPVLAAGPDKVGTLYATTVEQRKSSASLEPFVELLCYLISPRGRWLTGRLLSARWDRIEELENQRGRISEGSLLTLRRIDDALYREVDA